MTWALLRYFNNVSIPFQFSISVFVSIWNFLLKISITITRKLKCFCSCLICAERSINWSWGGSGIWIWASYGCLLEASVTNKWVMQYWSHHSVYKVQLLLWSWNLGERERERTDWYFVWFVALLVYYSASICITTLLYDRTLLCFCFLLLVQWILKISPVC